MKRQKEVVNKELNDFANKAYCYGLTYGKLQLLEHQAIIQEKPLKQYLKENGYEKKNAV